MALPLQLKSAISPFFKGIKVIGPTGIAALLSVGAHAALLATGPRTNFSFETLSRAAQAADAEETIVPLVQLTPAEQSRLPNFAQPRLQPPGSTDFGRLSLPSGLPFVPNTSIPKGQTTQANPFPSASSRSRTLDQLRGTFSGQARPFTVATPPANSAPRRNASELLILPNETAAARPADALPNLSAADGNSPDPGQSSDSTRSGGAADLQLPTGPQLSTAEALARAEGNRPTQVPDIGDDLPSSSPGEDTQGATDIPAEAPPRTATSTAQGNPQELFEGLIYDDTNTSAAAVETNTAEWLAATANGKGEVATDSVELTINSKFKACLEENPPGNGLIGVVVNPDGTQEDLTILKSTGYGILNRQAVDAVERNDFGTPTVPTQYQVQIAVTHNPSGCVESLPNEPAE